MANKWRVYLIIVTPSGARYEGKGEASRQYRARDSAMRNMSQHVATAFGASRDTHMSSLDAQYKVTATELKYKMHMPCNASYHVSDTDTQYIAEIYRP
jgi:hypothetical protein